MINSYKFSISTLILVFIAGIGTLSAQKIDKISGVTITTQYDIKDSIPVVQYLDKTKTANTWVGKQPVFFINGTKVEENLLTTVNPNQIESIQVIKDSLTLKTKSPNGEVHIKLKEEYNPNFISLNELKERYVDAKYQSTLFMVDDKIIEGDYDSYLIDEKFIMKIEVQFILNEKERLGVNIIKLITRTEENIDKANVLLLRG